MTETVDKLVDLMGSRKPEVGAILEDVLEQLAQLGDAVQWQLVIMPGNGKARPAKRVNFEKGLLHCEQCKQDFEVFVERDRDPDVCPLCGSPDWFLPF